MPGLKWVFLVFGFFVLAYSYKTKERGGYLQAFICFVWFLFLHFS